MKELIQIHETQNGFFVRDVSRLFDPSDVQDTHVFATPDALAEFVREWGRKAEKVRDDPHQPCPSDARSDQENRNTIERTTDRPTGSRITY